MKSTNLTNKKTYNSLAEALIDRTCNSQVIESCLGTKTFYTVTLEKNTLNLCAETYNMLRFIMMYASETIDLPVTTLDMPILNIRGLIDLYDALIPTIDYKSDIDKLCIDNTEKFDIYIKIPNEEINKYALKRSISFGYGKDGLL